MWSFSNDKSMRLWNVSSKHMGADLHAQFTALRNRNHEQECELEALREQIKDSEGPRLWSQLQDKDDELASLVRLLDGKRHLIATLENDKAALLAKNADLSEKLERHGELRGRNAQLERSLAAAEHERDELKKELKRVAESEANAKKRAQAAAFDGKKDREKMDAQITKVEEIHAAQAE
jgi:chromosome segregation ATPase